MNLEYLRQTISMLPENTSFALVISVILFFILIVTCGPLLLTFMDMRFYLSKKIFYDKCSLQMGQIITIFSIFVWCVLLILYGAISLDAELIDQSDPHPAFLSLAAFPLAALVLLLIYTVTRNIKKINNKITLILIHITAICSLAFLAERFLIVCGRIMSIDPKHEPETSIYWLLNNILPEAITSPLAIIVFIYLCCSGLAAAAAVTLPWLLIRRKTADYGRDYYTFAARLCAATALFTGLIATFAAGGALYLVIPPLQMLLDAHSYIVPALLFGLPLITLLLWSLIAFSVNPLRHKISIWTSWFFFFLALYSQFFTLMHITPVL